MMRQLFELYGGETTTTTTTHYNFKNFICKKMNNKEYIYIENKTKIFFLINKIYIKVK